MQNDYATPGENDNEVKAGVCDPVHGCPHPREIVCIQVDKIYQECKNVQLNEVEIIVDRPQAVTDVQCLEVELLSVNCYAVNNGRVKVQFSYRVRARLIFEDSTTEDVEKTVDEEKTFFLSRAGEHGLSEKCDIFLECLECFVEEVVDPYNDCVRSKIICCIGKLILVKIFAHVQLLIPAYGFCPQPPECERVEHICPDFYPDWPPYPPQHD